MRDEPNIVLNVPDLYTHYKIPQKVLLY